MFFLCGLCERDGCPHETEDFRALTEGSIIRIGTALGGRRVTVEFYDGLPRMWPRGHAFDGAGLTNIKGFRFAESEPELTEYPWEFLHGDREGRLYTEHDFDTVAEATSWLNESWPH